MLIKLIAFAAAIIPAILFLRAIFVRRPSKLGAAMREAKKQVDFAIYIFIGLIGCIVAFAAGKLAWSWWTAV
jgi:multisubunit Na+/H+ antiporter MnhB subunit